MSRNSSGNFPMFLLVALSLTLIATHSQSAAADGSPPSTAGTSASSPSVLKGNAKDEGRIQPSVKLLLAPGEKPHPHADLKVQQFSGTQTYKPGQPAPKIPPLPPPVHKLTAEEIAAQEQKAKQTAPPPRFNYQLTPKNGRDVVATRIRSEDDHTGSSEQTTNECRPARGAGEDFATGIGS